MQRKEEQKAFLDRIVETLKADERFVAAWLTGSLGRHGGDEFSDIDITLVVDMHYAGELCRRPWMVSGRTTDERLAVIRQFGEPVIIHENHYNAPNDGTFTNVTYLDNAFMVDYVFVPQDNAIRPAASEVLFNKSDDHFPLSRSGSESPEERAQIASEKVAFFWMMLAVAIKYMLRRDVVYFHTLLDQAQRALIEVASFVEYNPWKNQNGSLINLSITVQEQVAVVRDAARQMLELMPKVVGLGGYVPDDPMRVIEMLLALPGAEFPIRDYPITNLEGDKEGVKRLIHALETYIGKRLVMYIGNKTPENLLMYLYALETAMGLLLSPRNRGRDYKEEVIGERGWQVSANHPFVEMQEQGMDSEAILQEMIAIAIETWKRMYGIE